MILGGLTEIWLGVNAEQRELESVAEPLTAEPSSDNGALA